MILAVVVKVHEGSKADKIANITVRSWFFSSSGGFRDEWFLRL